MENIFIILAIIILIYTIILLILYNWQHRFTFQNKKSHPATQYLFVEPFQEIDLISPDFNERIHGLYFKAHSKPSGLVLYFHGNKGNLERWGHFAADFLRLNYDFFVIDYPGYGKSSGIPSESAIYKSAEIAYKWACDKYHPKEITIYGRSLGSAPAAYITSKFDAKRLILETPFYNFHDLAKKHAFLSFFPIAPKYKFPVNEFLDKTEIPITIFHGTKDVLVPMASTIQLKSFLGKSDFFIVIEEGNHHNLNQFELYHQTLKQLLS